MLSQIVLAHVSDIHFRHWVGGQSWDVNEPLRAAVERDLATLATRLGPFRGVVATGDIAFSGKAPEYAIARNWLHRVTDTVGCADEDVWVVPGNHDVDRSIAESDLVKAFHISLRTCDRDEIVSRLHENLVGDSLAGAAYMAPLGEYNRFATPYGCDISPNKPWWECVLPFGDTRRYLRLRGITSVLASDAADDQDANRQVIGRTQVSIVPAPDTVTMTLCHHPPAWLRDQDEVVDALSTTAEVQLWGHVHRHTLRPTDGNVHLFAGAVHPSGGETVWEPRYNVLRFVSGDDTAEFALDIYPRVWHRQSGTFGPDYNSLEGDEHRETVVLPHYDAIARRERRHEHAIYDALADDMNSPVSPPGDARRRLAFRFGTLPYQRRLSIGEELGLVEAATRNLSDRDLFELVFEQAVASASLDRLWDAVEREHGTSPRSANPFR